MKQFLLTALLGAMALGASAATETLTLSYVQPPYDFSATGTQAKGEVQAAMQFYAPDYAGMKVKKIDCYINADASTLGQFSNFEVIMLQNLELANQYYLRKSVVPKPVTLEGEDLAVLTYEFTDDNPYVVSDRPIYIGYGLTVDNPTGMSGKFPILIDKSVATDGAFYWKSQTTDGVWDAGNSYMTDGQGALLIFVTLEYDTYGFGLNIADPGTVFAAADKDFSYVFPVKNTGENKVSSISYEYTIDGGSPVSKTVTLENSLAPSVEKTYQVLLDFDAVDTKGVHELEVTVTGINGQPNESDTKTVKTTLEVFPYIPQHLPLVEEYTALACGYCPRGFVAMEYISEEYPEDAVVICYHLEFNGNKDPMTVAGAAPVATSNYPTASIDRLSVIDPYYGDYSAGSRDLGIVDDMFARAAQVAIADIKITKVSVQMPEKVIDMETEVTFMRGADDDQYRIGYVLSCDGLYNPSWKQTNYFSRDASIMNTPLINQFYNLPSSVFGLTFNDVAIDVKDMRGIRNSITDVETYVPLTLQYSFDVSDVNNIYGQSLNEYLSIQKMQVNAFIIEKSTNRIVNAAKFLVANGENEVEAVLATEEAVSTVYFDLQGRRVVNPDNGIFIKSETFGDGTVRTSKVVL